MSHFFVDEVGDQFRLNVYNDDSACCGDNRPDISFVAWLKSEESARELIRLGLAVNRLTPVVIICPTCKRPHEPI